MKEFNPLNEIYSALPELKNIKDTSENVELVSYKQWDARIKRICTSNLKKYGRTTSFTGMNSYFDPCIIQLFSDEELMEINREKYLLIRKYLISEENHK